MSETEIKAVLDAAREDEIETLLDSDASKWDGLFTVSLSVTTPGPGVATEEELNEDGSGRPSTRRSSRGKGKGRAFRPGIGLIYCHATQWSESFGSV
ncbi:MAG: hypothetical protein HY318_20685 [Armatimonadetes bacterium]|nr:hypothetical protein [Armatimonadota bacterium]